MQSRVTWCRLGVFAALVLLLAGSAFVSLGTGPAERAVAGPHRGSAAADVDRIQLHLANVESALRARDVGDLSLGQRARRATALDWLREYRLRGVFPHNHTHPGQRVPVFVDEHGTHCAVGYLLKRSGEAELIEHVVAADNNVRVMELAGSERLRSWLEETGLTLEEAAWIQPAYPPPPGPPPAKKPDPPPDEFRFALTPTIYWGITSGGVALYSYLSRPGPSEFQVASALGVAFSVYHVGKAVRIARSDESGPTVRGIAIHGVLSAVSLHAAINRFVRSGDRRARLREEAREEELREESRVGRRLQVSLPEPALVHGRLGIRFRGVH